MAAKDRRRIDRGVDLKFKRCYYQNIMAEESKKFKFDINLKEMNEVGLQFGHRTSAAHPKMKPYISGVKNRVSIINTELSAVKLEQALEFIKKIISEGKKILFIGTKIQSKDFLKQTAEECEMPYINERWLGGTFTNFKTIRKRIDYFKELEQKKAKGELEKYTKKERMKIDKELKDLEIKFAGIKEMVNFPDAIFVLDIKKDSLAVKEALMKNITVIAVVDTNVNPELTDYPIPANDDAISSIQYILNKVKEAIIKK